MRKKPATFKMDLGEKRLVTVTILPDGLVKFRPLYSHDTFAAHLRVLYQRAALAFAEQQTKERKLARAISRA